MEVLIMIILTMIIALYFGGILFESVRYHSVSSGPLVLEHSQQLPLAHCRPFLQPFQPCPFPGFFSKVAIAIPLPCPLTTSWQTWLALATGTRHGNRRVDPARIATSERESEEISRKLRFTRSAVENWAKCRPVEQPGGLFRERFNQSRLLSRLHVSFTRALSSSFSLSRTRAPFLQRVATR